MTPTYTRYADHSAKCRELTTGHAPYYTTAQRLKKKHMDKKTLKKLIQWIESEDYQDFSYNFTTIKRRVDFIFERYFAEEVKKEVN